MSQENNPKIAFTIENQLEAYSRAERHTQRHETLWHAWNQNRRWLSQLLELTLPAFPTYSRHDESHAKSVLHNIERILGEQRIRQLSASDCFMILHVTYVHDIGMCITAEDRKKILSDDEFTEMVERILEEGDESLQKAAQNLLKSTYADESDKDYSERLAMLKSKYREKLEVYYAVVYLMAEYQRKSHGEKASSRIHEWTIKPDQLGTGFSMSGIPLRLFLRIADCAALHTDWDFSHILELPKEDSGYAHDMIHPRFVAVMLQLGDALDVDNDRFHLFTKPFIGELPEMSAKHFEKHQSIRQLQISPEEIVIEADCDNQEALRLVRNECDAIEDILKSASYHWSEISPEELNGCLPTMHPPKIKLTGKAIPIELVSAKFNISQVKAFQLLEGSNVYFGHLVFLREVLHNAIDATKFQYWEDYKNRSTIRLSKRKKNVEDVGFEELLSQSDVTFYPIEIHFKIVGRRHKNSDGDVIDEYVSVENVDIESEADMDIGVLVSIKDYGTGISKADLAAMSSVGDSYAAKRRKISSMPEWLQPTGQFGIGLQSVFLICRSFKAFTRTHSGEMYEIAFNSAVHQQGYINTKPRQAEEGETYGTRFEIFVDCKHKLPHKQCRDAWNLEDSDADRFSSGYESNRRIRHSKELLSQMVVYINSLIGEPIFPIYVHVDKECIDEEYMRFIEKHASKMVFDSDYKGDIKYEDISNAVSWIFRAGKDLQGRAFEDKKYIVRKIENGLCALDCQNAKLHIWNSKVCTSATMGAKRLMAEEYTEADGKAERKTRVYLKGIHICEYRKDGDAELLESLDIKGRFKREYINLNRDEFTEAGLDFLSKGYDEILNSFREALEKFSGIDDESGEEQPQKDQTQKDQTQKDGNKSEETGSDFGTLINKNINKLIEEYQEKKNEEIWRKINETVLSVFCLSFFVRIRKHKEISPCCGRLNERGRECQWIKLNDLLIETLSKKDEKGNSKRQFFTKGFFKDIPVYYELSLGKGREPKADKHTSLFFPEILSPENRVAIISRREDIHSSWNHYVLILEEKTFQLFVRNINRVEDWKSYMSEIEVRGNKLLTEFEMLYDKIKKENDAEEYDLENQKVLKWMLSNIPSCGIWASLDGNTRMNILTEEISDSIYYNTSMKYLLLERILEQNDKFGGKRYVTLTWKGYEEMGLGEMPSSVCYVTRGYLAKKQDNIMLLPVKGSCVKDLLGVYSDDDFKIVIKILIKYISYYGIHDKVKGYVEDFINEREVGEDRFYVRFVELAKRLGIVELKQLPETFRIQYVMELEKAIEKEKEKGSGEGEHEYAKKELESLLGEGEDKKDKLERFYLLMPEAEDVIGTFIEQNGNESQLKEREEMLQKIAKIMLVIQQVVLGIHRQSLAQKDQIKEMKKNIWGTSSEKDQMIKYVQEHNKKQIPRKEIEVCYENMIQEMMEIIYIRRLKEKVNQTADKSIEVEFVGDGIYIS